MGLFSRKSKDDDKVVISYKDHFSESEYIVELETALYDIMDFNNFDPNEHAVDDDGIQRIREIYKRFDCLRVDGPSRIHYQ